MKEKLEQMLVDEENCFGDKVDYSLNKIKKSGYKIINLSGGYLVLDIDEISIDFALFQSAGFDQNKNESLSLVFYGNGTGGSLRKCRHTYWGESGYLFYMPLYLIKEAMSELKEYFDNH